MRPITELRKTLEKRVLDKDPVFQKDYYHRSMGKYKALKIRRPRGGQKIKTSGHTQIKQTVER